MIPARQARPVPADIPDEQVASFFVNPATVLAMVRHVLKVPQGEWLLQSAAGSTLGKMIIKLGRHDGFRTINVVRRREAMDELKRAGRRRGDQLVRGARSTSRSGAIVGGDGVRYALDPVGGETGTAVFDRSAADGRMLVYGTLSGEPIADRPPADDRREGGSSRGSGWATGCATGRSPASLLLFREIAALIRRGVLATRGRLVLLDSMRSMRPSARPRPSAAAVRCC